MKGLLIFFGIGLVILTGIIWLILGCFESKYDYDKKHHLGD